MSLDEPAIIPIVTQRDTIRMTIAVIESRSKGIALVIDQERRLLGTITDGDIRRAILAGADLDAPVETLLARRGDSLYPSPITAPFGTTAAELLKLMQERRVRQMPLLDAAGRVADLVTLDELLPDHPISLQAMIMAGGLGMRLRPLTETMPKPMLPVGDRPLMERTVEQLRHAGIRQVSIATCYMGEKIVAHFGDGHDFGVELNYVAEDRPLGTAGALGLMPPPGDTLLVINGDILTEVDFRTMLAYHQEHQAILTVGVRKYELNVPYGVVESSGVFVSGLKEKPCLSFFVNAGIYLLEPEAHGHIPINHRFDMTDLIQLLLDQGKPVVSFPIIEYWLDIGQHADYARAQEHAELVRPRV
jgi:dTDP-glucose pyrophosphorylase/CBS domain-containing protein